MEALNDKNFHWAEGMKFAIEGMKTIVPINGGAIIGILTFLGNKNFAFSPKLIWALACFAVGVMAGAAIFSLAYLTRLRYINGNPKANVIHVLTYAAALLGLVGFLVGSVMAALGLESLSCGVAVVKH